jgi:hypothetical protein
VSIRTILLSVAGGLVTIAIILLFVDVRSAPAKPNPQKVLEAQQKYKRTHSAPTAANLEDPWARSATEPAREPKLGLDPGDRALDAAREAAADPEPPPSIPTPQAASTPDLENDPRLETSNAKDEANRLYDKQDYEGAVQRAEQVLKEEPGDIRMLRVVVSSSCQLGDADKAKQYYSQLPPHDQNQMNRRCQRFGITFADQ